LYNAKNKIIIFATKARIDNRKKLVKEQYLPTCPYNTARVKLLLKGCGSPTESMAEIQIPVSRQVAIAHGKLFWCSNFGDRLPITLC